MGDLHQQLLAATEPLIAGEVYSASRLRGPLAAVRAVIELHAPVEQSVAARRWLDCCGCDSDGAAADWPCSTVRTIARELGIEAP